jgi:putative methylase
MVRTRRELAVFLSKLNDFAKPSIYLEQYPSNSEVASILLWKADLNGDILDKDIVDLGAGTGILGIGALLLGAKSVTFIDIDPKLKKEIEENLKILTDYWEIDIDGRWNFICKDVEQLSKKDLPGANTDNLTAASLVAVINPPFGTRNKHIDKLFLEKALEITDIIYTMHKTSTKVFINAFCKDNNLDISWSEDTSFPIKQSMEGHKKKIERIEVTLYNLRK